MSDGYHVNEILEIKDQIQRLKDTRDKLVEQFSDLSRRHQEVKQDLANALEEIRVLKHELDVATWGGTLVDQRPCPSCGVVHRS